MGADVVIAGGGPAGLAGALAFARRGARVQVLAGPDRPWSAGYGVWADRFEALGYGAFLGPVWRDAEVVFGEGSGLAVGRRYGRVAKRRLRGWFLEQLEAAGVTLVWRHAVAIDHDERGSTVTDEDGTVHRAALVIDASGHRPVFVRRDGEPTLFQAAFGQAGLAEHPWPDDVMTFMDWRQDHVRDALGEGAPTFLYVKPLGGARVFVEETSLVRGPAVPFSVLRARLHARLARLGVTMRTVDETELCLIPMDDPLPDRTQRVVGLGASASFVHPATGYQLCRSLAAAPVLADAVLDSLGAGRSPADAAVAGWQAIWPDDAVRRRELLLYGARLLSRLGAEDHVSFFRSFFSLPQETWRGYLADDGTLAETVRAMAGLLCVADTRTRWHLVRSGTHLPTVLARVAGGAA